MDKISFFRADYRDGRVHIGGKSYPAGTFATHLLNQFYENDTAARIGVFTTDNWQLENMLKLGYLNIPDYVKTGGFFVVRKQKGGNDDVKDHIKASR